MNYNANLYVLSPIKLCLYTYPLTIINGFETVSHFGETEKNNIDEKLVHLQKGLPELFS